MRSTHFALTVRYAIAGMLLAMANLYVAAVTTSVRETCSRLLTSSRGTMKASAPIREKTAIGAAMFAM